MTEFAGRDGVKTLYRFMRYPPADNVATVNLQRRDLTPGQRAAIVAELATLPRGGDRRSENFKELSHSLKSPTLAEAARMAGVGRDTVVRAKRRMRADPAAHRAAKEGRKSDSRLKRTITTENDGVTRTDGLYS